MIVRFWSSSGVEYPDVAIIPADELAGLIETAYLLRSPKNAQRLLESLAESKKNDKKAVLAKSATAALKELRRSMGMDSISDSRE